MAIKILSTDEINTSKYNAIVKEFEELQGEVVEQVKIALDHIIELDYMYEIKNHIDQLLVDWEEYIYEEDEEEDE